MLLVSDEVICAFGRLGSWFGSQALDYVPDMITMAKGLTSGYSPLGGVICSDRIAEPFLEPGSSFLHGITFGGHPVSCAVALANLDIFEREHLLEHVVEHAPGFRERIDGLTDLPIVGEVRGMGYFLGIELVRDPDSKETFTDAESEELLRGFLSPRLYDAGLICRSRRPRRSGAPAVTAAHRRRGRVRHHRSDPAIGPDRSCCTPPERHVGRRICGHDGLTVGVPREVKEGEHRVAVTPDGVYELAHHGVSVLVEGGAGLGSSITDDDYQRAGAQIVRAPTRCGSAPIS